MRHSPKAQGAYSEVQNCEENVIFEALAWKKVHYLLLQGT